MFGSKSATLLPAARASGKLGVVGAGREGRAELLNSTEPAAPKFAGLLVGSTLRVMVRPWLVFQTLKVLASSRNVEIAYPARRTLPLLPSSHANTPLSFGICHAMPSEGDNWW